MTAYRLKRAVKRTYDYASETWEEAPLMLRLEEKPFAAGGMRMCYRAREVLDDGSEVDVVVKRILPNSGIDPEINIMEAMTQMVAESYAQDFNKRCAEIGLAHSIAFLPVSALRVEGIPETLCIEPYLPGDYVKHCDNAGNNETLDEVAQAFSYFTYINSGKLLVVCDIQGVGTFFTDPQIHTFDGEGFGAGNLGQEGIDCFLRSHTNNLLCEFLGLPNPDAHLSDEELAQKLQHEETVSYQGLQEEQLVDQAQSWDSQRFQLQMNDVYDTWRY